MPICLYSRFTDGEPSAQRGEVIGPGSPPSLKEPSSFGCQYLARTRRSIHVLVQEGSYGAGFEPGSDCLWV